MNKQVVVGGLVAVSTFALGVVSAMYVIGKWNKTTKEAEVPVPVEITDVETLTKNFVDRVLNLVEDGAARYDFTKIDFELAEQICFDYKRNPTKDNAVKCEAVISECERRLELFKKCSTETIVSSENV